jgi:hypothetical protein
MVIRALCPISGRNDSRKRHEMLLISKLGTVHPSGINERFSYVNAIIDNPEDMPSGLSMMPSVLACL